MGEILAISCPSTVITYDEDLGDIRWYDRISPQDVIHVNLNRDPKATVLLGMLYIYICTIPLSECSKRLGFGAPAKLAKTKRTKSEELHWGSNVCVYIYIRRMGKISSFRYTKDPDISRNQRDTLVWPSPSRSKAGHLKP